MDALLVADRPLQILDADREIVDIDLEPDCNDAIVQLECLGGTADAAGTNIFGRLPQQVELDQLTDEARYGAARETGLGRHPRARAWLAGCDLLQHNAEICPPHGRLVGPRGRVVGALETQARGFRTGDVNVDSINPAEGFVWPSHKLTGDAADVKIW